MKTLLRNLIFLFFLFATHAVAAQSYVVKKDLKAEWLVYDNDRYAAADTTDKNEVFYIKLRVPDPQGEYFRLSSTAPVHLFVNNKLIGKYVQVTIKLDSLSDLLGERELMFAVYKNSIHQTEISTVLLSKRDVAAVTPLELRRPYFFQDFVVIGFLTLLILVVVMVRLNPKLAGDYFSIPRIFSFREMEDAQVYTRIGSSANILFYAYCSLLVGYYLLIIFHFVQGTYEVADSFAAKSFGGAIIQWLRLSGILLGLLLCKIILVIGLSSLFSVTEAAGIHFFNWVRMIVVFLGLLTLILVFYFIWYGQNVSILSAMLQAVGWILAGWILLIFLKLTSKSSASMFHLFSYICATELIPFLFIIKVLYY